MSFTETRTMTTGLLGPTVAEMKEFLDGAAPNARVNVLYDKGYNQFDPGQITFTVNIAPKKPAVNSSIRNQRNNTESQMERMGW